MSISSEMDDPMGLQHLFAEHPPGDSTTSSSAAAAAADTPAAEPPWAEVLQLSVCCLTRWMHPSNQHLVGLQAHHLDAVLYLLSQGDSMPGAPASTTQAANPSADAGASASTHSGHNSLTDSFRALRNVLVQLVQTDELSWACDHIVRSILIKPKAALLSTTGSNGNGNMASVMCLAATCLMSRAQSCSARREVCPLIMSMWVDLVGTLLSTGMTQADFIHQKASARSDFVVRLCIALSKRFSEGMLPSLLTGSATGVAVCVCGCCMLTGDACKQVLCYNATSIMTKGLDTSALVYTSGMPTRCCTLSTLSGHCLVGACLGVQAMLADACIWLSLEPDRSRYER